MTNKKAINEAYRDLEILNDINITLTDLERKHLEHIYNMEKKGYTTPYCDY